jgi:hypothetical protein
VGTIGRGEICAVVKRGIRASVEEYSIKKLERFYGFRREVELEEANVNLRILERADGEDCFVEVGSIRGNGMAGDARLSILGL